MKEELNEYIDLINEYRKPNIEPIKKDFKVSKLGILFLIVFYIWQYYFVPDYVSNFFLKSLNLSVYVYFFILDITMLVAVILIFRKELKETINNFKMQFIKFFKYLLYTLFIFSILNLVVSFICNLFVGDMPDNQKAIESLNLGYLLFSSLIYAPIVEELLFRASIHKFIKNKKVFILVSGLIFGLIHVIGTSSVVQYIYILEYGFCGCFLAFLYSKYDNIYLNISAHFLLNFMGVLNILIGLFQ